MSGEVMLGRVIMGSPLLSLWRPPYLRAISAMMPINGLSGVQSGGASSEPSEAVSRPVPALLPPKEFHRSIKPRSIFFWSSFGSLPGKPGSGGVSSRRNWIGITTEESAPALPRFDPRKTAGNAPEMSSSPWRVCSPKMSPRSVGSVGHDPPPQRARPHC